ncbi:MAG: acyltransferase [Candidatus Delongbacteria bacterium]|jgi:acetyltransferase-like isoleucine patch superfamily enzyme|nr:acyltransferase [Candidatus Delongbacteria bacterium]
MKDLRGSLFTKARYYRLIIYSCQCTLFIRIALLFRGVKYGSNVRFYGLPVIIRMVQSRIVIGSGCTFRSDFASNLVGINRKCVVTTLRKNSEVIIGDNSGFSGTVIAAAGSIKIGNNVLCGANTTITDYDWHGLEPDKRHQPADPKPVVIEDNVWLGLNSVVLKGVTIGRNSVIGANSIVTRDIPANVIAAGNPCKVIRELRKE